MANQNPVCLVSVWSNKTYCNSELNQFVCMMHVLCCRAAHLNYSA